MAFSYKRIVDLTALSMKDLNDQLEMLWKKVMGGVTADDLYEGASADIVSSRPGKTRTLKIENDDLTISTSRFTLRILDPDDPTVARLTMSADMNGFDRLSAGRIDTETMCVANEREGAAEFYVSPLGSDAADGRSAEAPMKTIAETMRRCPKLSTSPVTINLKRGQSFYENVNIYGYSGVVTLTGYGTGETPQLHGKLNVAGCGGFVLAGVNVQDDNATEAATLYIRYTPFDVQLSKFTRGSGAGEGIAAVETFASSGMVRNSEITGYNEGVHAGRGSTVHIETVTGSCNTPVVAEGGVVTGYAGWPQYVTVPCSERRGGKILTLGTSSQTDALSEPAASASSALYRATAVRTFSTALPQSGMTFIEQSAQTAVRQGGSNGWQYTSVLRMDYGVLRGQLTGKTVLSARMYFHVSEVGSAAARIHLVGTDAESLTGSTYSVVRDYGYVGVCPATGGMWFGIPTAAVTDIVSGDAAALGFYDDVTANYIRAYGMNGSYSQQPRLEITYN